MTGLGDKKEGAGKSTEGGSSPRLSHWRGGGETFGGAGPDWLGLGEKQGHTPALGAGEMGKDPGLESLAC